jgi:hypothetical protein
MNEKADKFLAWLFDNTDYGDWDISVQTEVRTKLLEILGVPEPKQHRWEFYMNGSFCKDCGVAIGSGGPCKP